MKKPSTLGKNIERIDAWAKVEGTAQYGADIRLNNMLFCKNAYSERAHAKLLAVHIEEAEKMPGVVKVVTGKDIPGAKMFGELFMDQYAIAFDRVRYLGDVIAVVAAETQEQANEAAKRIYAEYEDLPVLTSPKMALESDVVINPEYPDNICGEVHVNKGDSLAALKEADVTIKTNYKTQFIEHSYLEPESVTAVPSQTRNEITILGSIQAPYNARISMHRMLNIPMAQIIFRPSAIGGSFGGKIETAEANAIRVSLIALLTKRPAHVTLTREESMRESYKRHPIEFDVELGAKRDGTLTALRMISTLDAGAYINMSPPVAYKTAVLGVGPYNVDNVHSSATAVLTNNNHTGSMRGFGTPQALFALENTLDTLAAKLGMTPTEIRRKNLLENGDVSACGHLMDFNEVTLKENLEKVAAAIDFDRKYKQYKEENKDPNRRVLRGVGISTSMRGASVGADGNGFDVARVLIEVMKDGGIHTNIGLVEIGQGLRTVQMMMVAEGMGVKPERITMGETDTSRSPETGACIASRGTMLGGGAIADACRSIKGVLNKGLSIKYGDDIGEVIYEDDRVRFGEHDLSFDEVVSIAYGYNLTPSAIGTYSVPVIAWDPEKGYGEPFYSYTYSCQAAEVEVDLDTGHVSVVKMVGCHDPGLVINPKFAKGQVYGGLAMGQGMALTEDFIYSAGSDSIKNLNFNNYLLPTAVDVPDTNEPILNGHPDPRSVFGGRSLGEPATEPAVAAITCAVNMALGQPGAIKELPFNLERIMEIAQKRDKQRDVGAASAAAGKA